MLQTLRLEPEPGCRIVVDVLPGAAPTLVFLHGMSSIRVSDKSEALLARARRLGLGFARFDFRGHGDSDGRIGDVTLSELVADVLTVVAHVGPSVLVGSSLGGLVAAWAAVADQQGQRLLQAMLLLCPALGFLSQMTHSQPDSAYELVDGSGSTVSLSPRVLADAQNYNETSLPTLIELPTLIVHGDRDDVVPYQLSERFHQDLAAVRKQLWRIEGGNHRLNEPIEQIYDRLEAFLGNN